MQNLNWQDLRLLLEVSRHSTMVEVGRSMGIATTTVSRRVRALEVCVGSRLVHRTHVGTVLTPAGKRLIEALTPLALELEAHVRDAAGSDSDLTGTIKVSTVEGLVDIVLQAIHGFRGLHPGVMFELDASHRLLDMTGNEADVALRTVKPRSPGLVVRRVEAVHFGVYAAASQVATGAVRHPHAFLARNDGVILGGALAGLKENAWLRRHVKSIALQTDSLASLIAAVKLGIGVAVLPEAIAARDSGLRRVCDCDANLQRSLWLVMNAQTARLARVRAFADHVTDRVRHAMAARP
jgi:DNA-binding transcriptional LysR family regulator